MWPRGSWSTSRSPSRSERVSALAARRQLELPPASRDLSARACPWGFRPHHPTLRKGRGKRDLAGQSDAQLAVLSVKVGSQDTLSLISTTAATTIASAPSTCTTRRKRPWAGACRPIATAAAPSRNGRPDQ